MVLRSTLEVTVANWPIAPGRILVVKSRVMVSPTLAPTWKAALPKLPSRIFWPLKAVWLAIRSISANRCCTSKSNAARSEAELVALADCTANSRIRCKLELISAKAPSAVCDSEIASLALREAWLKPRICVVKRSEIAKPAASSLALLMRSPDDKRCREVARSDCDIVKLRWAFNDAILVLITEAIVNFLYLYYLLNSMGLCYFFDR